MCEILRNSSCAYILLQSYSHHYNQMANVHGFRDINNQPRSNNQYQNLNAQQIPTDKILFMNSGRSDVPPMDESIPYTLKIFCCPTFQFLSVTTFLILIIWSLYITCCFFGIQKDQKTYSVLQISEQTLISFGAAKDKLIKQGEVYRLVTAAFLHWNLMHIVSNTISMLIILTRLQNIYPFYYIVGMLLTSAITGNISSVLYNKPNTITVGASTMLFGVLGSYIGYMAINWEFLGRYPALRSQTCCIVSIITIFSILFSIGPNVDFYGHFTGMLGGFLFSIGVFPGLGEKSKIYTVCGLGTLLAYNITVFVVFYLTD